MNETFQQTVLPPRSEQLCGPKKDYEGLLDYGKRAWNAEFDFAVKQIEDVNIRNALYALKMLRALG